MAKKEQEQEEYGDNQWRYKYKLQDILYPITTVLPSGAVATTISAMSEDERKRMWQQQLNDWNAIADDPRLTIIKA